MLYCIRCPPQRPRARRLPAAPIVHDAIASVHLTNPVQASACVEQIASRTSAVYFGMPVAHNVRLPAGQVGMSVRKMCIAQGVRPRGNVFTTLVPRLVARHTFGSPPSRCSARCCIAQGVRRRGPVLADFQKHPLSTTPSLLSASRTQCRRQHVSSKSPRAHRLYILACLLPIMCVYHLAQLVCRCCTLLSPENVPCVCCVKMDLSVRERRPLSPTKGSQIGSRL
jgi:hypothetical protein